MAPDIQVYKHNADTLLGKGTGSIDTTDHYHQVD